MPEFRCGRNGNFSFGKVLSLFRIEKVVPDIFCELGQPLAVSFFIPRRETRNIIKCGDNATTDS